MDIRTCPTCNQPLPKATIEDNLRRQLQLAVEASRLEVGQIAKAAGLTKGYLNGILAGKGALPLAAIEKVFDALDKEVVISIESMED